MIDSSFRFSSTAEYFATGDDEGIIGLPAVNEKPQSWLLWKVDKTTALLGAAAGGVHGYGGGMGIIILLFHYILCSPM